MDKILAAGVEIPVLENNSIHRLYLVAENHYSEGYSLFTKGSMLESFVLLMRFTKLFELINEHPNRYMRYERYNKIKKNFGKSIGYLEVIKPQLEDKYKRQESKLCLPTVPIGSVFSTENLDEQDKPLEETPESILDEERRKREIDEILLRRWEEFNKPRPKPVEKQVEKPVPKPVKTTDDLSDSNKSLSYKDKDGKPLDALAILEMHLITLNRSIVDVPGDNNCQFHAVADQLERIGITGWNAMKLRHKAVKWLQDNEKRAMDNGKVGEQTYLKDAVGVDDWQEYVDKMRIHDKTWGDEATMLALSVLFKISIVVVSSLPGNYTHEIRPPQFWNIDIKGTIYLGHYHEFHYTSTKGI
jgi:hypothetical protein